MLRSFKLLAAIIIILIPAADSRSAENYYKEITITASAGPSYISGFYEDYLQDGMNYGIGAFYNLPFLNSNTYFTGASLFQLTRCWLTVTQVCSSMTFMPVECLLIP